MKKLILFIFAISLAFSCEKLMPFEGVKYILNSNVFKTRFAFQFINAKTKEPIGIHNGSKISVRVLGPDKDYILSSTGLAKSIFLSDHGFLSLGINTSFTPTESRKLDITLVFEANGYLSNSMRLHISNTGNYFYDIPLVEIKNLPDGVASVSATSSAILNSQTTSDLLIETPIIPYSQTKASLKIDKGTIIKDKDGNNLYGPLKISLFYFNNMQEDALAAHPGGLISRVDSAGKIYEGSFSTAGYVVCDIKDKFGKEAYSFSKAVTYHVEVNAVSTNPLTGQTIQMGEKLGVWSYNQETAIWKFVKAAVFQGPITNGHYEINSKVYKLLPYNWDWFDGNCVCNKGVNLLFNYPEAIGNYGIMVKAYSESSNQLVATYNFAIKNGDKVTIQGSTLCSGVFLQAYNDCGQLLGVIHLSDLCDGTYPFDLSSAVGDKTISVKMKALCGSDTSKIVLRPTAPVWYQAPCNSAWHAAGNLENGAVTFSNLEAGKNYTMGTFFDNKWVEFPFTTESNKQIETQIMLSSELCNLLDR